MKLLFKLSAVSVVLLAVSVASATSVSFIKTETDAKKGLLYIYGYTCNRGNTGKLTVTAANDSAAQKLAETKARKVCEEL